MFQCIAERRAKEPLRAWWHFEKLIILLLDTGFRLTEALHCNRSFVKRKRWFDVEGNAHEGIWIALRSEEHTSELQSLMRISYAVFCLKKKNYQHVHNRKQ